MAKLELRVLAPLVGYAKILDTPDATDIQCQCV